MYPYKMMIYRISNNTGSCIVLEITAERCSNRLPYKDNRGGALSLVWSKNSELEMKSEWMQTEDSTLSETEVKFVMLMNGWFEFTREQTTQEIGWTNPETETSFDLTFCSVGRA
jgi:hypothetical protein